MALQYYTKFLRCFKKTKGDRDDTPLILRYNCYSGYLRISIIDGESENECKISGLKSLTHAYFVGCCNGLALFTSYIPSRLHIVVNPLSNEIVATVYGPFRGGDLCGFFFHPTAKEYRILSARKIEEEDKYEYQLYQFGSKKWRKIANPYFKHKPTHLVNPAIVNDALHWDMGVILVFDMISEALSFKHAPFEGANGGVKDVTRRLLVNEDRLCFCFLGCEEPLMDIWVLEDYAKWSWTKKYSVDLDFDMNRYPMESGFRFTTLWDIMGYITIVGIQNNELVLLWKRRGMFSYHLGSNTLRKIHLKKSTIDSCVQNYFNLLSGFEVYSAIC